MQSPLSKSSEPTQARSTKRAEAAFTLVELLVTVIIMMLVLVMGTVNYLQFFEKQKLYQFGGQLEAMLKDARAKAEQGFLGSEDLGFCEQLKAVEVYSSQDANGYLQFKAQLRCTNEQVLSYEEYTVSDKNVILSSAFQVSYLPRQGVNLLIAGQAVDSGSITLHRSSDQGEAAAQVLLNLDRGAAIEFKYE